MARWKQESLARDPDAVNYFMPQVARPALDRSNISFKNVTTWEPQPHLWSLRAIRSTVYLLVYPNLPGDELRKVNLPVTLRRD